MEIGIEQFAAISPDSATGKPPSATDRMADLLEEIEDADALARPVGMGASPRRNSWIPRRPIILAAELCTKTIRLTRRGHGIERRRPVRVFQEFATLEPDRKRRA